ncbi:hypothetical protein MRX96_035350 [Rhipicephalus microplus]
MAAQRTLAQGSKSSSTARVDCVTRRPHKKAAETRNGAPQASSIEGRWRRAEFPRVEASEGSTQANERGGSIPGRFKPTPCQQVTARSPVDAPTEVTSNTPSRGRWRRRNDG